MSNFRNDLLNNQQIHRRTSTGLSYGREFKEAQFSRKSSGNLAKPAFRPAGISSLFEQNRRIIDKVKQNPARIDRRDQEPVIGNYDDREQYNDSRPSATGKFFSLVLTTIPFATLFFLVVGIFFVIYSQGGAMDWLGREVISTGKDQGSQQSLVLYAGLNQGELPGEEGEAIPLDMTETFAWQTYKVKRGDSVSKIALDFSVSMDAIIASNGITNARSLREGEVLRIPNMDGIPYTVRNGDTLSGISQSMGVPLEAILDANDLQSDVINTGMSLFIPGARMNRDDLKLALGELFVYPVRGARLSSPFGWRNDPFTGVRSHHAGVDLSISQGAPIKAAMDGTVSTLGVDRIYGNYIILSHSSGLQTLYAHLNSFSVKRGDRVLQGVQIGTVGSTGYSTGPHLHFAVFKNGRAVNPLDFLAP